MSLVQTETGDRPAGDAVARLAHYMRQKTQRFATCLDEALATGELEAIHGLRVASRRLHEPLDAVSAWIARKDLTPARRGLRRMRRAFRRVRDLDVLLHSLLTAPSGGGLAASDLAELESRLAERRAGALRAAQRRCAKLKPRRTLQTVRELCDKVEGMVEHDEAVVAQLDHRVVTLARGLIESDPRSGDDPDLHAARIRIKHLRYSAELAAAVADRPTTPLIAALTTMQDMLGHWNDQGTAARWLARLASGRKLLDQRSLWSARLLEHAAGRARSADAQRERIFDEWSSVSVAASDWLNAPDGDPAVTQRTLHPQSAPLVSIEGFEPSSPLTEDVDV